LWQLAAFAFSGEHCSAANSFKISYFSGKPCASAANVAFQRQTLFFSGKLYFSAANFGGLISYL